MNRALTVAIVCSSIALGAGCALLPEWRVFQKKVPATLTEKPKEQIEGERRAARYIQQRSEPRTETHVQMTSALGDIHLVATNLSSSLGEPLQPIGPDDRDSIIAGLRQGLIAKETQLEAWKAFGRKYAGKELEGTGIDVAGPTGLLVLAAIVAACIACPALGWLVLRVVPLLWSALRQMTAGVEAFAQQAPEEAAKLKTEFLARKMDAGPKALIKRVKKSIQPHELESVPA